MPRRCSFKLELDFRSRLPASTKPAARRWQGRSSPPPAFSTAEFPRGIDDSKNLPLEKREALYAKLTKVRSVWASASPASRRSTAINIYLARMLAMTRAVEALGIEPAWVLVDGNATPKWQRPSKAIVNGDANAVRSPQPRSSPRSLATG